jgi:hypothetical protein
VNPASAAMPPTTISKMPRVTAIAGPLPMRTTHRSPR